jgi:L-ascorbate metabolism protein UlaG (beta-lactamase superfamily)
MKLTWLGQGGFLVVSGRWRLAVDPYLSDALAGEGLARMTPPPCSPQELSPTLVVCTHDHADHLDSQTIPPIAQAFSGCLFAGPATVVRHLGELGIGPDRCRVLGGGEKLPHGCMTIAAAPARHEGDAIGVIVQAEGLAVYISGDTLFFDALADGVRSAAGGAVDVAAICINGKWGNMTWQQAVEVVAALRPRLAVPMHYGMFRQNTADPALFVAAVEGMGIKTAVLEVGLAVELPGPRR